MTKVREQLSEDELNLLSRGLLCSGLAHRVMPIVNGLVSEKTITFGDDTLSIELKISDSLQNKGGKESCYSAIIILTSSLEPHLFDVYATSEVFLDSSILKRNFLPETQNQQLVNGWSEFCGYIRKSNPQLLDTING